MLEIVLKKCILFIIGSPIIYGFLFQVLQKHLKKEHMYPRLFQRIGTQNLEIIKGRLLAWTSYKMLLIR